MKIKGIIDADYVSYKEPSMTVLFPHCNYKCDADCEERVCQGRRLMDIKDIDISPAAIVHRYMDNPVSKAIVISGLEPMDDFDDLEKLLFWFRFKKCNDEIVIYTGYTLNECKSMGYISRLQAYKPVTIKFGRYIPRREPYYDEVLGVELASDNQFAKRI